MKNTKDDKSVITMKSTFAGRATAALLVCSITLVGNARQDDLEGHFELPSFEVRPYTLNMDLTLPTPTNVVVPRLRSNLRGTEVRMTFYIDKEGHIYSIDHDASSFDDRKSQVGEAMKQKLKSWHFSPAVDKQGNPCVVKVALPVKVVAPEKGGSAKYAGVILSKPVLVAVMDW